MGGPGRFGVNLGAEVQKLQGSCPKAMQVKTGETGQNLKLFRLPYKTNKLSSQESSSQSNLNVQSWNMVSL